MKFALVMQCWQSHSKGESIIGLIKKNVGCPDCDIHLFGRQYSCNPYRESIILHTKQTTCCSYKYTFWTFIANLFCITKSLLLLYVAAHNLHTKLKQFLVL